VWSLLAVAVIVGGVTMSLTGTPVLGVPIAVFGVISFFIVIMYLAAAGMYMRTILYRYATHKPLPDLGLDLSRTFQR
jgi:membrane-bound ClpP family serine protease